MVINAWRRIITWSDSKVTAKDAVTLLSLHAVTS